MYTTTVSAPYYPAMNDLDSGPHTSERPTVPMTPVTQRRANLEQGRAFKALQHAVEYLIDSHMFSTEQVSSAAHSQAMRILKQARLALFADCAEIVPLHRRVGRLIAETLSRAT